MQRGLVAHFGFAGTLRDFSSHAHKAAATGQPRFEQGPDGLCAAFDGDWWLEAPLPARLLGDTFTVQCLVQPLPPTRRESPASWGALWRIAGLAVMEKIPGADRFRLQGFERIEGNQTYPLWWPGKGYRSAAMAPGQWYHVAAVFSPQCTGWYVNGIEVETFAEGLDLSLQEGVLRIGKDFHGRVADFRLYRNGARAVGGSVPAEQRLRSFAQLARIEVFADGGASRYRLGLAPAYRNCAPAEIDRIDLSLSCLPMGSWKDSPTELGVVSLNRKSGFVAEVELGRQLPPGLYMVTAAPTFGDKAALPMEKKHFGIEIEPPAQPLRPARLQAAAAPALSRMHLLDGPDWRIMIDPDNDGLRRKWHRSPARGARVTPVPWSIQEKFPGYHGVAWYWRSFQAPSGPLRDGRCLLKFEAVDYLAEVWLNGVRLGGHRGGETPFTLDATEAIRPGRKNLLAVRVLNPTIEPIDGMTLFNTAKSPKFQPVQPNATYNAGGIHKSVWLVASPGVRVEDATVTPDWATGRVGVKVRLHNSSHRAVSAEVVLTVEPASGDGTAVKRVFRQVCPPGASIHQTECVVENHRLWELDDPCLYRLTVRVRRMGASGADQWTGRFGFRDFRYEGGAFRLNGRRVFLNGATHIPEYAGVYLTPHDRDFARRDFVVAKALGLNFIRVAFGTLTPAQLDACDELGILLVQSHRGCWQLDWKIREWEGMEKEFDRSIAEVVRRDRNHPSIVIWDWMNETLEGRLFRHGVEELQFMRRLDRSRMVLLNSGRTDQCTSIGDLSNPGSLTWDGYVRDGHLYPPVPHTAAISRALRAVPGQPFILTEYSQCGAMDCPSILRQLEQAGMDHGDDAAYYRQKLRQFMADWRRWKLDRCWSRPEEFFEQSHRNVARLRRTSAKEALANPNLIGMAMWNSLVDLCHGCGSLDQFRLIKPDHAELMQEISQPLQWCLFAGPLAAYRGQDVLLEAVLANHDRLKPGKYPVRFQVVREGCGTVVLDRTVRISVPAGRGAGEGPLAFAAFSHRLRIDAPAGRYRFTASFQRNASAVGGEATLHLLDRAEMPPVMADVTCVGDNPAALKWMRQAGIRVRPLPAGDGDAAENVIVAMGRIADQQAPSVLARLARSLDRGATLVVLTPHFFWGLDKCRNLGNLAGVDPNLFSSLRSGTNRIPLVGRGRLAPLGEVGGYYRPDDWGKRHPMLAGLHGGGILDYGLFREILPQESYVDLDPPLEAVAGGIRVSGGGSRTSYASGLHLCVLRAGRGRVILNTLMILPNLGRDPVAERLLRNILNYAGILHEHG